MFVARSAGRIRLARTLFVLAALLPTCVLVAWAMHLRSPRHLDAIRRDWQRAVGLPVTLRSVSHPRPGVVRAEGVAVGSPHAAAVLPLGTLEVEVVPGEWRLRLGRLRCGPVGVRLIAGLAREWLERGPRFEEDGVIEIMDFAWEPESAASSTEPKPLRIECVRQDGARAIRIHRPAGDALPMHSAVNHSADSHSADNHSALNDVRIVRRGAVRDEQLGNGRVGKPDGDRPIIELEASWAEPLPFDILAAAMEGMPLGRWSLGPEATVVGRLHIVDGRDGGQIQAQGRLENIDLASCAEAIGLRARGRADAIVHDFAWRAGRLVSGDLECAVGAGRVERRFLDTLVTTVGCRPGPGYAAVDATGEASFDAASCRIQISSAGVSLTSGPRLGGPLAVIEGRSVVEPPLGAVPASRLAWLVAPPDAAYVPSAGPGAWLLSIMPQEASAADQGRGERASQADAADRPRGF
jgi:hypothetical protein